VNSVEGFYKVQKLTTVQGLDKVQILTK